MPHSDSCVAKVRGGILADGMGLGKTLEVLALMASDSLPRISVEGPVCRKGSSAGQPENGTKMADGDTVIVGQEGSKKLPVGGTLIVCPMSILPQV